MAQPIGDSRVNINCFNKRYKMVNFLVRLLCLFIPVSAWRKAVRREFFGPMNRPNMMRRFSKIANWRTESVQEVRVATGVLRNGKTVRLAHVYGKDTTPVSTAFEVFYCNEYCFSARGKAVVIDIGMSYGFASLYFAMRDDVDAVYSFEPVKPIYERALFNFSLNECADKIVAHNYGLGDGDKSVPINFNPAATGATSTMREHQSSGKIKLSAQIKDAAAEISGIIAKHPGKRVVIKCDCEGAESEIFARLESENILSGIDLVMMEYHHDSDRFIEPLLSKRGFACFKSSQHSLVGIIRAVNQVGGSA